jgi:hypothetical protein
MTGRMQQRTKGKTGIRQSSESARRGGPARPTWYNHQVPPCKNYQVPPISYTCVESTAGIDCRWCALEHFPSGAKTLPIRAKTLPISAKTIPIGAKTLPVWAKTVPVSVPHERFVLSRRPWPLLPQEPGQCHAPNCDWPPLRPLPCLSAVAWPTSTMSLPGKCATDDCVREIRP